MMTLQSDSQPESPSGELLLAEDPLQQCRVPVHLGADGLAVTDGEYVGVLARFASGGHLGDRDDRIALGDKSD